MEGQSYKVTVGIGNPEDGAHLYDVTFANGCSSDAEASEAPEVQVNALQNDAHEVYSKLLSYNTDIPAVDEMNPPALSVRVQKAYASAEKTFESLLDSWEKEDGVRPNLKIAVYKIEVDGQNTFAIVTPNLHDSIREWVNVYDTKGRFVDSASVYSTAEVGQNGVTWQDASEQK